ncbi:uncharacterized protein CMU_012390 [Cryptosporidium muris RN66]|uniref:E3 UFM1-protein ligase 1-like N-terminal domain-containing protein n=1 Tax=Cryptosporidium muris (strain RN66) TaxID=441375 RepID=B6AEE8_CRYMR|nr:uncharacterized protein CMU_012390 [Cryptosporidium muris RN66]EEA06565.1 hypothetical protein, conserved [Cryptosporidium muris RN66]|eukprot:XP_002140914.1 hypothetical protein [Cryptosporidium muris RN66]
MSEIEELQKLLEIIQNKEESTYLNENVCVDILCKLLNKGKLELINSTDGSVFYTKDALYKQIYSMLELSNGRLNISFAARNLNVNMDIINALIRDLQKTDHCNKILIYNGDIISNNYTNNIFEKISRDLQNIGILSLNELSQIYNLSIGYLKGELVNKINSGLIQGKIIQKTNKEQLVISIKYIDIVSSIIRGCLSVAIKPVLIDNILDCTYCDKAYIGDIIQKYINSKIIFGFIIHDDIYIPQVYYIEQTNYIQNFILNNGYININKLQEILNTIGVNISNNNSILKWLKVNIKLSNSKYIIIGDHIIQYSFIENILTNIQDCIINHINVLNILPLLPCILNANINSSYLEDINSIVKYMYNEYPYNRHKFDWFIICYDETTNKFTIELNEINYIWDSDQYIALNYNENGLLIRKSFDPLNTLFFFPHYYCIINGSTIYKMQNIFCKEVEEIIKNMDITDHTEISYKDSYSFIQSLISEYNRKQYILHYFEDLLHDLCGITMENIDDITISMKFEDLVWNFLILSTSVYLVNIYNARLSDIFNKSNTSYTLHIEDC